MTDVITISPSFNTTEIFTNGIVSIVNGNTTLVSTAVGSAVPLWAGFIGCLVASLFFGSFLVPVKQFSAGDGFFFQFVSCAAIYVVGLIVDLILGNQRLYPLVLVGGVLWTTGNLVTVFCIKTCGLAVGLLIWGTTSLIMGWAGGRFGLLGVIPQIPSTTTKAALNYSSVVLAAVSAIIFLFIKASPPPPPPKTHYDTTNGDQISMDMVKADTVIVETEEILETDFPFLNRLSDSVQKILGCALAALAGVFYGTMFIPDQYIRDHPEKFIYKNDVPSSNGLYYVHSQYAGIFLSSLFYFLIYAIFKRNRPTINPEIALPAIISGAMWGVANIGFIVAISALKSAVAYPIVSVLPGIVTSFWALFRFKEIQGKRNYIILAVGMILRCIAALLSGLSA